jgi:formate--tetrahydrofolate ligase
MGMSLADYTITEAGFGFDLGGEKFLNIKCQAGNLKPEVVVLTATIKALKYHGDLSLKELKSPNAEAVKKGLPNLQKHLENIKKFNLSPVIALNKFTTDTKEEVQVLRAFAEQHNYRFSEVEAWENGGKGSIDLANAVLEALKQSSKEQFKPLYKDSDSATDKIEKIAQEIYGADGVDFQDRAKSDLNRIESLGFGHLPICMAKTQKSFSDNDNLRGRPKNFRISIREIELASGAGFIIPVSGKLMRMPGLPAYPAAEQIDVDHEGRITGLF